jgi:hypothetical protein
MKRFSVLILSVLLLITSAQAQTAEVTIQLNEQFFDALLDAVFKNSNPPEFPLSSNNPKSKDAKSVLVSNSLNEDQKPKNENQILNNLCPDRIRLEREIDGTRTAVRFREGRIVAPIAFTGNYNPPLVGCIDFSGVADTLIDLEFNAQKQVLIGRAHVQNINLTGAGGLLSSTLARMVQSSIDKKVNPIQIIAMDKISFIVPIQNSGSLKMKANAIRHEISNGVLNIHITYEFQKAT